MEYKNLDGVKFGWSQIWMKVVLQYNENLKNRPKCG
jgi:hypothetical protein